MKYYDMRSKNADRILYCSFAVFGTFVVVLLLNLFGVLSDAFVVPVADFIGVVFSAVFIFASLRYLSKDKVFWNHWRLIVIGVALWMMAHFIWFYYSMFIWTDIPQSSIADIFWFLGYIPFIFGMFRMNKSIFRFKGRKIILETLLVFVFSVSIIFFYFVPIMLDSSIYLMDKIVVLLYPVLDIIIFTIAIGNLIGIQKGRIVFPWIFLGISFLLFSVADALYPIWIIYGIEGIEWIYGTVFYMSALMMNIAAAEMIRVNEVFSRILNPMRKLKAP